LNFISVTTDKETQPYYQHLRTLWEIYNLQAAAQIYPAENGYVLKSVSASESTSLGRIRSPTKPPQQVFEGDSE
jgi:hypothetical protein